MTRSSAIAWRQIVTQSGRNRDRAAEFYRKEENREALRQSMRREKALDFILSRAKREDAPSASATPKRVHLSRSSIIATRFGAIHGCSTISEWLQFEGVSGLLSIVVGTWLWRGSEV